MAAHIRNLRRVDGGPEGPGVRAPNRSMSIESDGKILRNTKTSKHAADDYIPPEEGLI